MLITLEPHGIYFDRMLHTYVGPMSTLSNRVTCLFLMDEVLLRIGPAGCGQLVKMIITLEPHGIFGSTFTYLFFYKFILTLSSHWYAKR